jgi:hypothetical protein
MLEPWEDGLEVNAVAGKFLSGDCIVIGRLQPSVTKPTRMTLTQFTKLVTSGESRDRPACVGGPTESTGQENVGQKQFATDVVVAMSNPTL